MGKSRRHYLSQATKYFRRLTPVVFLLAIEAQGAEVISSPSPDGKFVLRIDREKQEAGIVEKASHKTVVTVDTSYEDGARLVWSADSQRVAYEDGPGRRSVDLEVFFRKGKTFEKAALPEGLPHAVVPEHRYRNGDAKNISVSGSTVVKRWLKSGDLVLESTGETEIEGERAALTITIGFDKEHKASVRKTAGSLSHYLTSGDTKETDGDHEGAIADYTRALEVDAKSKDAFAGRGQARESKGDLDGAIADYTKGAAYSSRAGARQAKGDYAGAITDYTRCIQEIPKDSYDRFWNYLERGGVFYLQHSWPEALSDFRHAMKDVGGHANILVWLARVKMGEKEAADKELAASLAEKAFESEAWSVKLAGFLLDQIPEAELFKEAAGSDHIPMDPNCEAWFYAGIKRGLAGERNGARDSFAKCEELTRTTPWQFRITPEFRLAGGELKALGEAP